MKSLKTMGLASLLCGFCACGGSVDADCDEVPVGTIDQSVCTIDIVEAPPAIGQFKVGAKRIPIFGLNIATKNCEAYEFIAWSTTVMLHGKDLESVVCWEDGDDQKSCNFMNFRPCDESLDNYVYDLTLARGKDAKVDLFGFALPGQPPSEPFMFCVDVAEQEKFNGSLIGRRFIVESIFTVANNIWYIGDQPFEYLQKYQGVDDGKKTFIVTP